ncbi:lysosomal acid glucosylceramidase-like [Sitodiplosis mosellana]|uniref:lysosomal acid glucosylceramidase-like n=1 Tax=Sitodiplosis mosellana TaxID=263140 RepID=UPI0024441288|nr:lysosomal acid glucosylceramidase-like [Sitodiplosis mosellana]
MSKLLFLLLWFFVLNTVQCVLKPCQLRKYPDGYVCVCNETYCDTMDVEKPERFGDFILVSSTKSGKRFDVSKGRFQPKPLEPNVIRVKRFPDLIGIKRNVTQDMKSWLTSITLTVDQDKQYQKIIGFGGAFTGSVSHLFDLMPESLRHALYRNYYSPDEGIAYSMMRIPIGGCDFDLRPWAYNEQPIDDQKLSNFTKLDARDLRRNEQINDLKKVAQIDDIKLIGTAWSSPKWMKTNNQWSGRNALKPEYYQTWADYHLRFLSLMAAENMTLWGLSTGNEPLNGEIGWFFIHFMSLGWLPENQGKWIGENLGPNLNNSEFRDIKLFAGDDQRYTFPWWFDRLNRLSPKAMDYVSGLAVHWYWDRLISPFMLDQTYNKYPDKMMLNTESCIGDKPFEVHGPVLGSWSRAERYALGIIQDLQHHVAGWIDWNLILNESGGPTYINNTVDAAVILNSTTKNEIYKQPIFYVLGHFSKFIPTGSVRIEANLNGFRASNVKTVAFLCPDNTITIILYNRSDKFRIIDFTDDLRGSYEIRLDPRSIASLTYA